MNERVRQCGYVDAQGHTCDMPAGDGEYCFWHDPDMDKSGNEVRDELKALFCSGRSLAGFKLAHCDLIGIELVHSERGVGCDLRQADLYGANLSNANLMHADLRGASLGKANLFDADLQFADLDGANLLGVNLRRANMEQVHWGDELYQERLAREALTRGEVSAACEYFRLAEEIYRSLLGFVKHQGLYHLLGMFLYKELLMRRMQMPLWSWQRLASKLFDLLCGYGERPGRVVIFSSLMIVVCSIIFFLAGIDYSGQAIVFDAGNRLAVNAANYAKCLYFSVVTFTTLGYGDFVPIGPARIVSAVEAFTGSFSIALFVVVFVRKMTR